jgi:mRNA interferase RelE/StbE
LGLVDNFVAISYIKCHVQGVGNFCRAKGASQDAATMGADRIRGKIAEIATSPYDTHNNVTKLQGRNGYRLRVGDWRVLYELHDGELVLLMVDVLPCGSAYKA